MLVTVFAILWLVTVLAFLAVVRQYRRGEAKRINLLGTGFGVLGTTAGLYTAVTLAGLL